jgi:hypothetical protein
MLWEHPKGSAGAAACFYAEGALMPRAELGTGSVETRPVPLLADR